MLNRLLEHLALVDQIPDPLRRVPQVHVAARRRALLLRQGHRTVAQGIRLIGGNRVLQDHEAAFVEQ